MEAEEVSLNNRSLKRREESVLREATLQETEVTRQGLFSLWGHCQAPFPEPY